MHESPSTGEPFSRCKHYENRQTIGSPAVEYIFGLLTVMIGNIPWKPRDRTTNELERQNNSVRSQGADQ